MAGSPTLSDKRNKPATLKPIEPSILNVLTKMEEQGKAYCTIDSVRKNLTKFAKFTNIDDPSSVAKWIATQNICDSYKANLVRDYQHYCDYYQIEWKNKPKYRRESKLFKCPTEQKLNSIIAGSHEKLALKLRISKECGLRPIEIVNLIAKDLDADRKVLTPKTAKHGASRALKLCEDLCTAIQTYINVNNIKPDERLFKITAHSFGSNYQKNRRRVAKKLGDPTILNIRLYDFRHFFGTMTYKKTQNAVHTAYVLGHRNLKNTQVYIDIQEVLNDQTDEFNTAIAKTIEEACKLVADGWTHVLTIDGVQIFKKRK